MADRIVELAQTGWIAEHRDQYLNNGEEGHLWDSSPVGGPGLLPTLLLFTKGRRSGKASVMPLLYAEVEGGYAIIASRGGHARHPGWYHNLVAESEVEVKLNNDTFPARARTTGGDERELIWGKMASLYPPFADYAVSAAPRQIPVVVLDRL